LASALAFARKIMAFPSLGELQPPQPPLSHTSMGVSAVLKFLKFQKCPEIWNCPEILLIWQECPENGFWFASEMAYTVSRGAL